jgi:hypothetical protein
MVGAKLGRSMLRCPSYRNLISWENRGKVHAPNCWPGRTSRPLSTDRVVMRPGRSAVDEPHASWRAQIVGQPSMSDSRTRRRLPQGWTPKSDREAAKHHVVSVCRRRHVLHCCCSKRYATSRSHHRRQVCRHSPSRCPTYPTDQMLIRWHSRRSHRGFRESRSAPSTLLPAPADCCLFQRLLPVHRPALKDCCLARAHLPDLQGHLPAPRDRSLAPVNPPAYRQALGRLVRLRGRWLYLGSPRRLRQIRSFVGQSWRSSRWRTLSRPSSWTKHRACCPVLMPRRWFCGWRRPAFLESLWSARSLFRSKTWSRSLPGSRSRARLWPAPTDGRTSCYCYCRCWRHCHSCSHLPKWRQKPLRPQGLTRHSYPPRWTSTPPMRRLPLRPREPPKRQRQRQLQSTPWRLAACLDSRTGRRRADQRRSARHGTPRRRPPSARG